ncbi:iron ABC transporter ATP-binding protein FetA [Paramixta manurensis]|uniref:Iron ABC transporter ATP-binding protein FetA n=1 Tax=Paramixta manurensis TaxID=2740817 RepID=A0A6M8UA92_9GAMM|nr:iron ABC transporter ATP-binding protein FetA [Erwiniaceae bacterium PD-1]
MSRRSPLLTVNNLSYLQQGVTLLAPISFELALGEQVMLSGPSGCGKSTLLKLIASLLTPSGGRIALHGRDSAEFKPEAWRQQVSYCFQTPSLFGETVYANLAFPYVIRQQPVVREPLINWLARLGLPAAILDKPIASLSGGERQRVALLRNLQFMPAVLLLDEVTSALDDSNKQLVRELIRSLRQEHPLTVLWVSHDREEIAEATRVITMTPATQRSRVS